MLSPHHGGESTEPAQPDDEFSAHMSQQHQQEEQKSIDLTSSSDRQHDIPPPRPPPPPQNISLGREEGGIIHTTPTVASIDKPDTSVSVNEQSGHEGQVYDTGLSEQWPQQQQQSLSHQQHQQYQRPQQQHLQVNDPNNPVQSAHNQMRLFMGQNYVPNVASQQHLYSQPSAVVSPVHAAVGPSGIATTSAAYNQPSLPHSSFFDLGGTSTNAAANLTSTSSPSLLMEMTQFGPTDFSSQQHLPQQQQRDTHYDMYSSLAHVQQQQQQTQQNQHQQPASTKSSQEASRMSFPTQHIQPSTASSSHHHHHQYNPSFRHSITLPLTHVPYLQQQPQNLVTSSMIYDPITVTDLSRSSGGASDYVGAYGSGGGSTSPTNLVKRKNAYDQSMQTSKKLKLDEGISVSMPPTPMHEHRPGQLLDHQLASQPFSNMQQQQSRLQIPQIGPPSAMMHTTVPGKQRSAAWTRIEEDRLQVLVDAGMKWSEITREFPNRSAGAIKKHYYADMRHTSWSEEEDSTLRAAHREDEEQKWRRISEKVGKPAKACEKRMRELTLREQRQGPGTGPPEA